MWRFSPRSEEAEPYIRLSKLGDVLYWKDEPLESLALEASGANFWESQRAVGIYRDYTFKGHIQNPTHSGTQGRDNNLKGAPQIHLWILENLPERQDSIWEHRGWQQPRDDSSYTSPGPIQPHPVGASSQHMK